MRNLIQKRECNPKRTKQIKKLSALKITILGIILAIHIASGHTSSISRPIQPILEEPVSLEVICVHPEHNLEQGCIIVQPNGPLANTTSPAFIAAFFESLQWVSFTQNMPHASVCALVSSFQEWFNGVDLSLYGINENCP